MQKEKLKGKGFNLFGRTLSKEVGCNYWVSKGRELAKEEAQRVKSTGTFKEKNEIVQVMREITDWSFSDEGSENTTIEGEKK